MMTQMVDLGAEQLDGLYKLFVAECARTHTAPTFSDFHIWLTEKDYIDE